MFLVLQLSHGSKAVLPGVGLQGYGSRIRFRGHEPRTMLRIKGKGLWFRVGEASLSQFLSDGG